MSREGVQKSLKDMIDKKPDTVIIIAKIGDQLQISYQYQNLHEFAYHSRLLDREVDRKIIEVENRDASRSTPGAKTPRDVPPGAN